MTILRNLESMGDQTASPSINKLQFLLTGSFWITLTLSRCTAYVFDIAGDKSVFYLFDSILPFIDLAVQSVLCYLIYTQGASRDLYYWRVVPVTVAGSNKLKYVIERNDTHFNERDDNVLDSGAFEVSNSSESQFLVPGITTTDYELDRALMQS